jgi:hypothetical protein
MRVDKKRILKGCRHFMRPIVRFLLRHGVTWDEFSELTKDMYVDVAREGYGLQGRPTNNSRVAMMTGLSRREVARIRAWHVDEEFSDAGQPKDLPQTGPSGSLPSLLKRYAGDLPHSALRKEMLQQGLIEETDGGELRVLKRDYIYTTLDPDIINQMSVSLHDHATTLDHNLNEERQSPTRFEGIADNSRISSRSARTFMKLVETRGMDFLKEMDGWLSAHETDENNLASGREVRMGVGIYLIHDDY